MKKRIFHYLLLAVLLVGIPLGCCLIGGFDDVLADVKALPPRTEDWGSRPDRLWNCRCPFNWWVFAGMCVFVAACLRPFAARFIRIVRSPQAAPGRRFRFPLFGWVGLAVMLAGWVLAWTRFGWFVPLQRYPYVIHWAGFILLVNALCVRRSGRSPLTSHTRAYLLTFPASVLFWWFFEYLNRYVWNWYYVGIPGIGPAEYVFFASCCFSTVLPGVTAIAAWLGTFRTFSDGAYAGMIPVNIRSGTSRAVLAVLALTGLAGIVFAPQFAFPLLWISPLMVFILVQVALKERCVLDVLAGGDWTVVFRFAVAALLCGLVWETWNYYSLAKWVYAVPYVYRFRVWEMPLIGFAGYLPFGMECAVIAAWLSPALVAAPDGKASTDS